MGNEGRGTTRRRCAGRISHVDALPIPAKPEGGVDGVHGPGIDAPLAPPLLGAITLPERLHDRSEINFVRDGPSHERRLKE